METGNDHTIIPKNCLQYGISISVAPQNLSSGSMKIRMTAPTTVPKITQKMPMAVKSPAASFVLPSPILEEHRDAHPPSIEARAPCIMKTGEQTLNAARAVGPRYLEMNRLSSRDINRENIICVNTAVEQNFARPARV